MNTAPNPLPVGTELGRTALRVADSDAVADFYRDVVGLSVLDSGEPTVLGAEDPLLVLLEDEGDRDQTAPGLFHTAVRVPTRAALGDALARIRDRWQLEGASDHGVSEALYLSDPEGNGVEIYSDRPREQWPRTDDGGVDIYTERLDIDGVVAAAEGGDAAPPATDIGHVHLEVTSLSAVEEFYVDQLGFDLQASVRGARFLGADGYHHHIGANTWQGRTGRVGGRGLAWFEVVLPDEDSLAAVKRRVDDVTATAAGVSVRDPDGIEIRLRTAR